MPSVGQHLHHKRGAFESLDDRYMTVDVDDLHGFLRRGSGSAVYNGRRRESVVISRYDALQTRIRPPPELLSTASRRQKPGIWSATIYSGRKRIFPSLQCARIL